MIGHVLIEGQIGSYLNPHGGTVKGVELLDVVSQVQSNKEATEYHITIDSPGGAVDVGYSIYNYLKSLKGKVTTIGRSQVASISSIIFLAGEVRLIEDDAKLMIHNPWLSLDGFTGDADAIHDIALGMRETEDKMIDTYFKVTGITREAIDPLMKSETYMTADKAIELGFATGKVNKIKPLAFITNNKNENNMSKELLNETKSILSTIKSLVGKLAREAPKAKALEINTTSGEVLTFETDETEEYKEGDAVTMDGEPAHDGDYVLTDGNTVTVKDGLIEAVTVTETETEDGEMSALKKENAELKNQLAEQATVNAEIKTQLAFLAKNTTSKYTPKAEAPKFKQTETQLEVNRISDAKKKRESYKK